MKSQQAVKPGDGHLLPGYHWWQAFSRSLFHLHIVGQDGGPETWSIDIRPGGDADGEVRARLYRNGVNKAVSLVPAAFAVPGGTIEVEVSGFGLKRCHYVRHDGSEQQLLPDPVSAEGRRARLEVSSPALSHALGFISVSILAVAAILGVPQIVEQIMLLPPVAERFGTLSSPFHLPAAANAALFVTSVAASTERALRLRYNWLLDGN
jgi:hypothetical protein